MGNSLPYARPWLDRIKQMQSLCVPVKGDCIHDKCPQKGGLEPPYESSQAVRLVHLHKNEV